MEYRKTKETLKTIKRRESQNSREQKRNRDEEREHGGRGTVIHGDEVI